MSLPECSIGIEPFISSFISFTDRTLRLGMRLQHQVKPEQTFLLPKTGSVAFATACKFRVLVFLRIVGVSISSYGMGCDGAIDTNMRVLIWDKSRKLYLAERGRWVGDPASGRDFHGSAAAIVHLCSQRLTGVDLWYAFPNSQYDFTLPLGPYSSPATPKSERLSR
jgi:hypothetical protein